MEHVRSDLEKLSGMPAQIATLTEKVNNLPTKDDFHTLGTSFTKRLLVMLAVIAALVAFADRIQAFFH